jgi:hypothetical protein
MGPIPGFNRAAQIMAFRTIKSGVFPLPELDSNYMAKYWFF